MITFMHALLQRETSEGGRRLLGVDTSSIMLKSTPGLFRNSW